MNTHPDAGPVTTTRRRWIVFGALAAIAIGAVAIGITLTGTGSAHSRAATRSAHTAMPPTPADGHRLEVGLAAQDSATLKAVLAPALDQAVNDPRAAMLPTGSIVRLDITHATVLPTRRGGIELAVVTAIVEGPEPGRWRVVLEHDANRWLVLSTEPQSPNPTGGR